MRPFYIACGRFFFRYRDFAFPIVLVALLLGFRPVYLFGSQDADCWMNLASIILALSGQALRMLVIGFVYVKRGGKDKKVYADSLVTEGFFNHCRNPLYVGNLMVVFGLIFIHGNPWCILAGALFFCFAYGAIVADEEAYLQDKFGAEYSSYTNRVSRWMLDFRGLRHSLHGMRFAWERVILKEYGTLTTTGLSLVLLLIYEKARNSNLHLSNWEWAAYGAALGVTLTFWTVARILKKSRLLREAKL